MKAKIIREIDSTKFDYYKYIAKVNGMDEQTVLKCPKLKIGQIIEIMPLKSYTPNMSSGISKYISY